VVPSDAVAAAARARGVALEDPDDARIAALGSALAADYVVGGGVVAVGGPGARRVRLELRVSDGASGALFAQMGADGDEAQLFALVARLGAEVRARLGQDALSPAERSAAAQPSNLEAAREFADGVAALRRYELQSARAHFERAVALEPNSAKYHAGLASAWRALQFPERTRQAAERAFALSGGLPRPERMFIEARHHEAARRYDQAIELYSSLATFFPENIEYRLTLVEAQSAAGRPRDALATLDRLRTTGGAGADDPRSFLLEAAAAGRAGDADRAQRAALAARDRARALGAPAMQAQAELAACSALGNKELDQARAACQSAADLGEQLGDRAAVARALAQAATVRERQGAVAEGVALRDRALAIYREIGNLRGAGLTLYSQGNSLKSRGKLDEALAVGRQALEAVRQAGDDASVGLVLSGIAATYVERGELEAARAAYLESIDRGRRVADDKGVAISLQNLAWVERDAGNVIAARRYVEEARSMQERSGQELDLVFSLDCAGVMALEQDDPDAAEKLFQRALALREKLKMKKAATLQNLAEVRLVRRRFAEARAFIAQSLTAATGGLDEGFAREIEMRILLESGDLDGAARALARSRALTGERSRVSLDIDEARLLVARGRPRAALAMLPAALARARKRGALAIRIAVDAATGEAELAAGIPSGDARLAGVEKEAAAHGYVLMARLAAELRAKAPARPR
jgi:Tfp pilus assembly protein PilF